MRYCRVMIETEPRGCVYKKDFDTHGVFSTLVRTHVSDLIKQGVIQEGHHYTATIFPRYGEHLLKTPVMSIDQAKADEARPWLTLEPYNGATPHPDESLTFFTVQLRVKETGLVYNRDFQILDVDYFWLNLQTALLRMHVLAEGDMYLPQIFVRDDGEADFEREEASIIQDEDAGPLFELISVESSENAFEAKSLGDFDVAEVRESTLVRQSDVADGAGDEDVEVLIAPDVLDALHSIARADVKVEQGGMLVGHVYRNAESTGGYLVEITDYIVSEDDDASLVALHYTFESWSQNQALLREHFPGKRIVGWYHTHLVSVQLQSAESPETTMSTELFFSQDDRFMHRRFFEDRWYVALVLGSQGTAAFFRWFGDRIGANHRFHVLRSPAD